jgi:acyl carrier protein
MAVTMNNENHIKEKVQQFIRENTYTDPENILSDTLIFKEGYFDSMGFITLITFLEDEFHVKTEDKDFVEENFESINAITEYVNQKLAVKT